MIGSTRTYYRDVLQRLTVWKPKAPKLRDLEGPVERDQAAVPEAMEVAIEQAEEEITDGLG